MKTVVIAIRDQKANNFTQPFTAPSIGIALRSWGDQINDPKNAELDQARHPEDFAMWHIGEYDDNTGEMIPCKPVQLAVAASLVITRS